MKNDPLLHAAFPHVQNPDLTPVYGRFVQIDIAASFARVVEVAKIIDPLAWEHGYQGGRIVSLRMAARVIAGLQDVDDALIIDVTAREPGQPVPEVIPCLNVEVKKPSIIARLSAMWRNR